MTEQEFLELNIFGELKNLNTGYDTDGIWHFSAEDFEKVMDKAEEFDIRILGIECWEKEEEKFTKYYEDYKKPKWYRQAYEEFNKEHSPCIYTATFDIPPIYLQEFSKN